MNLAWRVGFAKAARKDARKVAEAGFKDKVEELLAILRHDPYRTPPPFEKLVGDLTGFYSRRINRQHRLVYKIDPLERTVTVSVCGVTTNEEMAPNPLEFASACRPFLKS